MCYLAAVLVSLNSTIWWLVPSADKTQLNHPFKPRGHTRVNKGLQDERRKWQLFSVTVLVVSSGEIHSPKIKWHGLTRALTVWCSLSASQTDFLHSAQELAQHPFWLWGDFWGRVEGQIQAFFLSSLRSTLWLLPWDSFLARGWVDNQATWMLSRPMLPTLLHLLVFRKFTSFNKELNYTPSIT